MEPLEKQINLEISSLICSFAGGKLQEGSNNGWFDD